MHLQLGISPDWFGDQLFDPGSDRVRKVTAVATRFVEKHLGGGVFAARFDVDEESGGGVVDVFASPVHENARSGRKVVSCRKSVQALGKASGHAGKPLRGLQDLWHRECASKLDEAIERGAPVEETQAVHLGVDEYKLLKGLEERALYAIRAVRRRWRQRARTRQQEAAVDKDPLLALLEAVVKPDLTDEEYAELSSAIEGPARERARSTWARAAGAAQAVEPLDPSIGRSVLRSERATKATISTFAPGCFSSFSPRSTSLVCPTLQ